MTLAELIAQVAPQLPTEIYPNPRQTIRHLIQSSLQISAIQIHLHPEREVHQSEWNQLRRQVDRLVAGEPLAYVLKTITFLEWEFISDSRAFIPRPETEALISMVRERIPDLEPGSNLLDMCCGSGAMGLSLALSFPQSKVTLCELSPEALDLSLENTKRHGLEDRVRIVKTDLWEGLDPRTRFQIVVCNPPYVAGNEWVDQQVLEHEPHLALFSDDRGMFHVKRVLLELDRHLCPGGLAAFELGHLHADLLGPWLEEQSWEGTFTWEADPFGVVRFLFYQT